MTSHFFVNGARRDTGEDQQIVIEADDAAQAEQIASIRGLVVASIRPVDQPKSTAEPLLAMSRPSAPRSIAIVAGGVILGLVGLALIAMLFAGLLKTASRSESGGSAGSRSLPLADRHLFDALKQGDIGAVKRALQEEPNIKAFDPTTGKTPLHLVIRKIDDLSAYRSEPYRSELAAWRELAAELVKAGADVNADERASQTPLHEATSTWTIQFLLDNGANVNSRPREGTPLYWKSADVWYSEVSLLLSRGADPNIQDFEGQTPLHRAAAENQTKIIELLLKSGAEVNKRDNKGYTPLKRARLSFQREAAELLQKRGGVE